jgi:hypothetical protein
MPKNILILNQNTKNDANLKLKCYKKNLTLGQNSQKCFNLRPKCSSQNMFWLGFQLHGLKFNIKPRHIDFQVMFLFLWPKVISH